MWFPAASSCSQTADGYTKEITRSPRGYRQRGGAAIAYRVCSGEGLPRLTIQPITVMPMRVKGVSVRVGSAPSWATETRKSREDLMLPDRFSIDGTVVQ